MMCIKHIHSPFFKNCVHWMYTSFYVQWKMCRLNIHIYLHFLKIVCIDCTQLYTFLKKCIHPIYTFVSISWKLYKWFFFLGMKIIQVEGTQLCIFLEKKCINWTYIITLEKINSFLSTVMALDPSQKTNTSFACYDLLCIWIVI